MVLVDIWKTTGSRENIGWISFLKKDKIDFLYLIWWHYFFLDTTSKNNEPTTNEILLSNLVVLNINLFVKKVETNYFLEFH